jgi:hypothetical protein
VWKGSERVSSHSGAHNQKCLQGKRVSGTCCPTKETKRVFDDSQFFQAGGSQGHRKELGSRFILMHCILTDCLFPLLSFDFCFQPLVMSDDIAHTPGASLSNHHEQTMHLRFTFDTVEQVQPCAAAAASESRLEYPHHTSSLFEGYECISCGLLFATEQPQSAADKDHRPLLLPCKHSWCIHCAFERGYARLGSHPPVCPHCRQSLPGSITELPVNKSLVDRIVRVRAMRDKAIVEKKQQREQFKEAHPYMQELPPHPGKQIAFRCIACDKLAGPLHRALVHASELSEKHKEWVLAVQNPTTGHVVMSNFFYSAYPYIKKAADANCYVCTTCDVFLADWDMVQAHAKRLELKDKHHYSCKPASAQVSGSGRVVTMKEHMRRYDVQVSCDLSQEEEVALAAFLAGHVYIKELHPRKNEHKVNPYYECRACDVYIGGMDDVHWHLEHPELKAKHACWKPE